MSSPGITPPRNIAPIEVLVSDPHTTIWMLGGMIVPMTAEAAVMPTAYPGL